MPKARLLEIRLSVAVSVDVEDATLAQAALSTHPLPSAITRVVADEIRSNLQAVPYVHHVTITRS